MLYYIILCYVILNLVDITLYNHLELEIMKLSLCTWVGTLITQNLAIDDYVIHSYDRFSRTLWLTFQWSHAVGQYKTIIKNIYIICKYLCILYIHVYYYTVFMHYIIYASMHKSIKTNIGPSAKR